VIRRVFVSYNQLRGTRRPSRGRWIADAHRDDGKRYVVRADEKLTAFVELEASVRAFRPAE
jgi:hypothetical protein